MLTLTGAALRLPIRQLDGPQPASVRRVTGGLLFVELEAAKDFEVGPCAWSRPLAAHSHTDPDGETGIYSPPDPAAGTRCLLLFAGDGISDPWVVAWDGWPA